MHKASISILEAGSRSRKTLKIPEDHLFSLSVVFDSLRDHGLQHTRLPYPSLFPRVHSNSCPLSQRSCLTISSSATPFSFCFHFFQASFPMDLSNWIFPNELALCIWWPEYWSLSFSISPSNEYSGFISFRIGWFDMSTSFYSSLCWWTFRLLSSLGYCE